MQQPHKRSGLKVKIIEIGADPFSSMLFAFHTVLPPSGIPVVNNESTQDKQQYHDKGYGENNDQNFLYIDKDDMTLIGIRGFLF